MAFKQVHLRIEKDLYDRLQKDAKEKGTTLSRVINEFLNEHYSSKKEKEMIEQGFSELKEAMMDIKLSQQTSLHNLQQLNERPAQVNNHYSLFGKSDWYSFSDTVSKKLYKQQVRG